MNKKQQEKMGTNIAKTACIPRKHQLRAIDDIVNGLIKNNKIQFISACGTGKTKTALWSIEKYLLEIKKLDKSLSIFFYPSLALVSQSFKDSIVESKIKDYNPVFVCSDTKIAIRGERVDIDIKEFKKDISRYSSKNIVTTDAKKICQYLESDIQHKIIYSTYQSSDVVVKALIDSNIEADIAVFDEAHNVAVKDGISSKAVLLHDKNNPLYKQYGYLNVKKRLFMTATPKQYNVVYDDNEEENATIKQKVVYSMDNPKLFGKVVHRYSMREAIDEGVISDYAIVAIEIDKEFLEANKIKRENFRNDRLYNNAIEAIRNIAIIQAMVNPKYNINKTIAFCKDIRSSKKFKRDILEEHKDYNIPVEHIDGNMSHKEKEAIMQKLKNYEKIIVSNSQLLGEGVNVPDVDMVAFMNTTKSLRNIVQRIGRVQRIPQSYRDNGTTKIGYVFIPIVTNDLENVSQGQLNSETMDLQKFYDLFIAIKGEDAQLKKMIELKIHKITNIQHLKHIEQLEQYKKLDNLTSDDKRKIKTLQEKIRLYNIQKNNPMVIFDNINNIVIKNRKNKRNSKLTCYDADKEKDNTRKESYRTNKEFFKDKVFASLVGERFENQLKIEATLDFIEKYGFENLTINSRHTYKGIKNITIGAFRNQKRKIFNKLTSDKEKISMIEEFSMFPINYLGDNAVKFAQEHNLDVKYALTKLDYQTQLKIEATLDFIEKYGFKKLAHASKHTYKGVEVSIGVFRTNKRLKFNKLIDDEDKINFIEEFSMFPINYLGDNAVKFAQEHNLDIEYIIDKNSNYFKIEATKDFINKYGFEKLMNKTKYIYKGVEVGIGMFRTTQAVRFNKMKNDEDKINFIKEFSMFPINYLGDNAVKFAIKHNLDVKHVATKKSNYFKIKATLDFIKKYGFEKLTNKTKYIYKGVEVGIGIFKNNMVKKFRECERDADRIKIIKDFSMFPIDYLGKKAVKFAKEHDLDVEYAPEKFNYQTQLKIEATKDFVNKYGIKHLNRKIIYKYKGENVSIGTFRATQVANFNKLTNDEDKISMIKDFDMFPIDYLGKKAVKFAKEHDLDVEYAPEKFNYQTQLKIEATKDFINKYGFEKLTTKTKYTYKETKDIKIGDFCSYMRKIFNNLESDADRIKMIEEFSMFPVNYLGAKAIEFYEKEKKNEHKQ